MTPLRRRMTEDMQVRNFSPHTQDSYVQQVSRACTPFQQITGSTGDLRRFVLTKLIPTNEKKLAPSSILIAVSALRFLYKVTLHREWCLEDIIPTPKRPQKLLIVLSPEEVLQFLNLRTEHQASHHPYRLLCRWTTHLGGCPSESRRYRQRKNGHSSGTGARAERSICHVFAKAIGNPTRLVAGGQAQAVALSG